MISGNFSNCSGFDQFYHEILELHSKAHGVSYLDVHTEIARYVSSYETYRELGVNQGATAATALEYRPSSMKIYDINLKNFEPQRKFFEEMAKEYGVHFEAHEKSSLDPSTVEYVDVLYIDTLHTRDHLMKELELHHDSVRQAIICHDTYAKPDMHKGILEFLEKNPEWILARYHQHNVGYTTIERVA